MKIMNTREKSPALKLEFVLSISPGSHKTPKQTSAFKPRLKPEGFCDVKMLDTNHTL